VGLDGTDREINSAEYGAPPAGDDFLVLGAWPERPVSAATADSGTRR
jgi:hypothetical protein